MTGRRQMKNALALLLGMLLLVSLLMPAAMAASLTMRKKPMLPVAPVWQPPHSSIL